VEETVSLEDKGNWLAAETRADPQRLFILWAVDVRFCRTAQDFQRHFSSELRCKELISTPNTGP
jgi:hypothetical protein